MDGMRQRWFSIFFVIGLFLSNLATAGGLEALFAPKADLWEIWTAHSPTSTRQINHQRWDAFLDRYVQEDHDGISRLPYARITPADKQSLADYIQAMQTIPILEYTRNEQLAYWLNLYNAVTVNIILQHYPVPSIRDIDISPGFFADGPWGKKLLNINQQQLSLNDIEHRILRPVWKDPRIHYAVNCASLGCPNLRKKAFTAANTEATLDLAAKDYINHPRGVRFDEGKLFLSSIYSWFQSDFGIDDAAVIQHIRKYAQPELDQKLAGIDFISGDDYDWSLNDVRATRTEPE